MQASCQVQDLDFLTVKVWKDVGYILLGGGSLIYRQLVNATLNGRSHNVVDTSPRWKVHSIVVSVSVCRSVCLSACMSRKLHGQTSPNSPCMLTVAVARSSFVGDMLCTSGYVDDVTFPHNGLCIARYTVHTPKAPTVPHRTDRIKLCSTAKIFIFIHQYW